MKKTNVMKEQWDYLIILDACRYDYFEQVHDKYLTGDLSKKLSVGSSTKEWRDKSFTEYYPDVIYISPNGYINSCILVKGFSAREHFSKVYDLWDCGWDEEKGTVLPEVVTKSAIDIIKASQNKRAIIHYCQPHAPYLDVDITESGLARHAPLLDKMLAGTEKQRKTKNVIFCKIMYTLHGIFYWMGLRGNLALWKLREFLGMLPANHMDAVRRIGGKEGLRKAYKQNLEMVLKHVAELVSHLSGKVVITADHGEMLGENGCYGHWNRCSKRLLLEVPWLVIDRGKKVTEPASQTTDKEQKEPQPTEPTDKQADKKIKRQIRERLRALGYYD